MNTGTNIPTSNPSSLPDKFIDYINNFPIMTASIETIDGEECYVYGLKPRSIGITQIPEHIANILHMGIELGVWFVKNSVHHRKKLFKVPLSALLEQITLLGYNFNTPPEERYNADALLTQRKVTRTSSTVRKDVKKQVTTPQKKKRKPRKKKTSLPAQTGKTNKDSNKSGKEVKKEGSAASPKVRVTPKPGLAEEQMFRDTEIAKRRAEEARGRNAAADRETTRSIVEKGSRKPEGKLGDALSAFGLGGNRRRHFTD